MLIRMGTSSPRERTEKVIRMGTSSPHLLELPFQGDEVPILITLSVRSRGDEVPILITSSVRS